MIQAATKRKPVKVGYVSADMAPAIGRLLRKRDRLEARFLRGAPPRLKPDHSLVALLANPFVINLLWNPPDPGRFDVQSGTLKDSKKYQTELHHVRRHAGSREVQLFANPMQIASGKYAGKPKIGFGAYGREVGYLTYRYEQDRELINRILHHEIPSVRAVVSEGMEGRLIATVIVPNRS